MSVVVSRPPINVTDKPLADWLFQAYLVITSMQQVRTSAVSGDVTIADQGTVFLADAAATAFTVTLPDTEKNENKVFTIKKVDSTGNAVTIESEQLLDGAASLSLTAQYEFYRLISDGTQWLTI